MTTPPHDDMHDKAPGSPSTGTSFVRRGSSASGGRPSLRIVSDDPEELAAYAQAQRITREQGVGAEPLVPAMEPVPQPDPATPADTAFSAGSSTPAHMAAPIGSTVPGGPTGPDVPADPAEPADPAAPSAPVPFPSLNGSQYTASLPAFLNTDRVRDQVARRVPDSAWQEVFPVDPSLTTVGDGYDYLPLDPDLLEPPLGRELDEEELAAHQAERDERRAERRRRAAEKAEGDPRDARGAHDARGARDAHDVYDAPAATGAHAAPIPNDPSPERQEHPSASDAVSAAAALASARHASAGARTRDASSTGRAAVPVEQERPDVQQPEPVAGAAVATERAPRRRISFSELLGEIHDRIADDPEHAWQVGLICVTALASILIAIVMLYFPAQKLYLAIRENERLADELAQNYLRNDRMQRRVSYLQTEEGIQDEAHREYGYIMPGENAVSVLGVDVNDPYAPSNEIGGVERGSGQNTHTVATDILDRVFGVEAPASPETPATSPVVQGAAQPSDSGGEPETNPDADIVVD